MYKEALLIDFRKGYKLQLRDEDNFVESDKEGERALLVAPSANRRIQATKKEQQHRPSRVLPPTRYNIGKQKELVELALSVASCGLLALVDSIGT